MTYNCEIKEQAAQPTLTIRTRTPVAQMPQVLGQAFGAIAQYLAALGEEPAGPPFVAYYNMDMQDLDIEVGFTVSRAVAGRDNIKPGELPAGTTGTCIHKGPYGEVGPAYTALTEWIKAHGHEASGVAYEFYLNDPCETPPQELLTRVVFPLRSS